MAAQSDVCLSQDRFISVGLGGKAIYRCVIDPRSIQVRFQVEESIQTTSEHDALREVALLLHHERRQADLLV